MAVTNAPRWRTQGSYVYVDGDFGDDKFGKGTMAKPYRTLEKATFGATYPENVYPHAVNIVCRGYIKSPGSNIGGATGINCGRHGGNSGNDACRIIADYFGAAVYDGEEKNVLCGQRLMRMIVKNCPKPTAKVTKTVYGTDFTSDYGGFVGLGRASNANRVNNADNVLGLYSSSCLVNDAPLWRGVIGSCHVLTAPTNNSYHVYSKIKPCASVKVKIGSFANCTVYCCRIDNRQARTDVNATVSRALFADFDFSVAETGMGIYNSVIAGDCGFYKGWSSAGEGVKFEFNTETAENNLGKSIAEMTKQEYSEQFEAQLKEFFGTSTFYFHDCLFSRQWSYEQTDENGVLHKGIMNDPENLDFTLSIDSDAYFNEGELWYAGAMNRAMRIRAYGSSAELSAEDGSDRKTMCWDNRTATGRVKVHNGQVVYDTSAASEGNADEGGSILSKVVKVERSNINTVRGLFNYFASHVTSHGFKLNTADMFEKDGGEVKRYDGTDGHTPDNEEAEDLYMACKGTMYVRKWNEELGGNETEENAVPISQGYTAWLGSKDIISQKDGGAYFAKVVNMDLPDVVYVRANGTAVETPSGELEGGKVYFNDTDGEITYNGRTIAKGESFTAASECEYGRAASNTGGGVMLVFDDATSGWAPAQMMGDYWVRKDSNGIVSGTDGEPLSSGNPDAHLTGAAGTATYLSQKWLQFKIEASPMQLDPTVLSNIESGNREEQEGE